MKTEVALFLITFLSFVNGFQDSYFFNFSNNFDSLLREKTVIGRLHEDIILPCSFESGPDVIIHWKIQEYNVHSYYKDIDQLERQDLRYANRASLFHSEIHNGNASLFLRRLSLQDEGIYTCYVGTAFAKTSHNVVLKVGALLGPKMNYELKNTSIFLTCCVLTAHPHPTITWQVDNTTVSESAMEETGPLPQFYIKSTLTNVFPNQSYQCIIENSLLKQTWTGRWTMENHLHKMKTENISFSCQLTNTFSLQTQDLIVTWSRIQSGTTSVLAYFLSSSQNTSIRESRFSWTKQLPNQSDFSSTLTNLDLSDSAEYLCNISSSKYTLLTVHTLDVEQSQENEKADFPVLFGVILVILVVSVILATLCHQIPKLRCHSNNTENDTLASSNEHVRYSMTEEENMPLSDAHS